MATAIPSTDWIPLSPSLAREISDARLQLHYAAQFATALGISYLAPRPDDSHTNLSWDTKLDALCSREVRALSHAVRVAVSPRDLTLLVVLEGSIGQRIPLHGATIGQVESGLRAGLAAAGLDGRRLTLRRHYDLPPHAVAGGAPFDTSRAADFAELANWYADAARALAELRHRISGSEVRCWPHHFDIATLATISPGRTSSAGMLPGDQQIPEPYYYVNAYPAPDPTRATLPLEGGGTWNTDGWFGAVLTASRVTADHAAQASQVQAFLDSAFDACARLLRD